MLRDQRRYQWQTSQNSFLSLNGERIPKGRQPSCKLQRPGQPVPPNLSTPNSSCLLLECHDLINPMSSLILNLGPEQQLFIVWSSSSSPVIRVKSLVNSDVICQRPFTDTELEKGVREGALLSSLLELCPAEAPVSFLRDKKKGSLILGTIPQGQQTPIKNN